MAVNISEIMNNPDYAHVKAEVQNMLNGFTEKNMAAIITAKSNILKHAKSIMQSSGIAYTEEDVKKLSQEITKFVMSEPATEQCEDCDD